jgi:uncharacterized protein (DUF1778 family)
MATKKATRRRIKSGAGTRSKKKDGYVLQSVRMLVDENNKVREAAEYSGLSINLWCVETLTSAAEKVISKKAKLEAE